MKEKLLIDSEVILQQLKEQQAVNKQLAKQNQVLVEQMNKMQQRIDELLLQSIDRNDLNKNLMVQLEQMQQYILKLQNMLFGTKSEKSKKKDLKANKNNKKNSSSGSTSKQSKSNGRGSLSKDLPRKQTEHDIPEDERNCKCCDTELHFMGKIVTEQLDFKPAEFFVNEHIRYKYACRRCENIVITELPPQPVEKGLAGPGLLTEITLNKYQDHLPLYRQQQRFSRHGIDFPRSTLCDWIGQVAELFEPIVNGMKEDTLIPGRRIFTDDTTVPVLDKNKKGKTHTGRLWVYLGGGEVKPICAIYDYTPTRSKSGPKKFLNGFKGYLQADAFPGYDELYKLGDIIEIACWGHGRRPFADIVKVVKKPGEADIAIDFIGQLYEVEEKIKHLSANKRKYYRRKYSKPILKRFKRWLIITKQKSLPKSPIGKAINYVLNHWCALCNYLRDGILEIDNNTSERAMKPPVLGRKNYLFAGSHAGAKRAAIIYSIIETCKLNNVNSWNYIKEVLSRLPITLNKDIKQLYPYNWVPSNIS